MVASSPGGRDRIRPLGVTLAPLRPRGLGGAGEGATPTVFKVVHTCIMYGPLQATFDWSTDSYYEGLPVQHSCNRVGSASDTSVLFVESGCRWACLELAMHVPSP